MRQSLSRKLVRLTIGAALLLLVQGAIASRPVQAGCNHWVTTQAQRDSVHGMLDRLIVGDSRESGQAEQTPADHNQLPNAPPPCSGASCSGHVPPPLPTSVSLAHGVTHWGMLVCVLDLACRAAVHFVHDGDEPFLPSDDPSQVFHPPRSLA